MTDIIKDTALRIYSFFVYHPKAHKINGVWYKEVPAIDNHTCEGCIADGNEKLCLLMPPCITPTPRIFTLINIRKKKE